jgi:cell division protein FtsZ
MGTGEASGDNRAIEAAEKAISNPLLDGVSMKGAKGVIISITGGEDMRLMEVDEAASHIKELVDADANIIWGSAFNNDLEGKIRVSVVATGIEAENVIHAQPAKVFTFPSRPAASAPAAAPAAMTDEPEESDSEDEEIVALDLSVEGAADEDELVLDADDILTPPVGSPPIAPPSDEPAASADADDDEEPLEQPKVASAGGGGTLFERMQNIARGAPKAQLGEDEPNAGFSREPLDIPRFLNRQNNQ